MLTVKNLRVEYGRIAGVKNVSFEVPNGSIVALIGSNGAGKTTTLRAVSGLEKARSGSILFEGRDITNTEACRLAAAGIVHVPEGRKIFPTLTVAENLEVAGWTIRRQKKELARRFERVFELFPRIKERRSQLAGTLSGGEQQMLALGRALVTGGRLMLLDEPSMGLAPLLVDEIFDTIVRINKEGMTVLLVEQNAAEALEIADYAYVLEVGTISLAGPAAVLAADPRVKEAYLGI